MDPFLTGLVVSALVALILNAFFLHEERTGKRVLGRLRAKADIGVLRAGRQLRAALHYIGRDFLRQLFHYLFHRVLKAALALIRRIELALRNAIRVNKSLAKSVDAERLERTKLEEIAFHKAATALSDEEKRERRERMLEGV
ncbi:MAG TPA: hypothetical protein VFS75_00795 [Candidatus Paceibacterota bacterium]|nr:hypothetical protein [Candidatus Paceibacterota bacterium]